MWAGLPASIAIAISCAALCSIAARSLKCGITPMPSTRAVKLALKAFVGDAPEAACVAELGSGWGGVARLLASSRPLARVEAYETSPIPYWFSRLGRHANLAFLRRDFFKADFGSYDLVYCYLCPRLMQRLQAKFAHELKDGSLIISNTFALRGWRPVRIIELEDLYRSRLYVYVKGWSEPGVGGS